jgi:predicted nucleic acid-binding protein
VLVTSDERRKHLLQQIDERLKEAERIKSTLARDPSSFGWLVAADNLISLVTGGRGTYREQARNILDLVNRPGDTTSISGRGAIQDRNRIAFSRMQSLLVALETDCRRGLLTELEYIFSAESFDSFLEMAEEYRKASKKQESSILCAAVFEDSVRKLGKKHSIRERKVDALLDQLVQANVITLVKAKRMKAATGVRNKAMHAEWDAFDLSDVEEAIRVTREILEQLSS